MKPLTLIFNQLSESEIDVLRKFRDGFDSDVEHVQVQFFPRYGNSGAKVIFVRFARYGGVPYILKIASKDLIVQEWNACQAVKPYFMDAHIEAPKYSGSVGGIAYSYHGHLGKTQYSSMELADAIYSKSELINSNTETLSFIYEQNIETAYKSASIAPSSWFQEYEWYLRGRASDETIKIALGDQFQKEKINALGTIVINPLLYIDLLESSEDLLLGPVHGDLHTSNIVLDASNKPRLIDFAWSRKKAHILIDFVLMECSLRFMLLPRCISLKAANSIDKYLSSKDSFLCPDIIRIKRSRIREIPFFENELVNYIKTIRMYAKDAYPHDRFHEHYMKSLFLVLYGLLKFNSYDIHRGIRCLGLLAMEIEGQHQ